MNPGEGRDGAPVADSTGLTVLDTVALVALAGIMAGSGPEDSAPPPLDIARIAYEYARAFITVKAEEGQR